MLTLENYVAQDQQADHDQHPKDGAVMSNSPRPATCSAGSSLELIPREEDGHVSKLARRKTA